MRSGMGFGCAHSCIVQQRAIIGVAQAAPARAGQPGPGSHGRAATAGQQGSGSKGPATRAGESPRLSDGTSEHRLRAGVPTNSKPRHEHGRSTERAVEARSLSSHGSVKHKMCAGWRDRPDAFFSAKPPAPTNLLRASDTSLANRRRRNDGFGAFCPYPRSGQLLQVPRRPSSDESEEFKLESLDLEGCGCLRADLAACAVTSILFRVRENFQSVKIFNGTTCGLRPRSWLRSLRRQLDKPARRSTRRRR